MACMRIKPTALMLLAPCSNQLSCLATNQSSKRPTQLLSLSLGDTMCISFQSKPVGQCPGSITLAKNWNQHTVIMKLLTGRGEWHLLWEHWLVFGSAGLCVWMNNACWRKVCWEEQSQDHSLSSPTPRSRMEFQPLQLIPVFKSYYGM